MEGVEVDGVILRREQLRRFIDVIYPVDTAGGVEIVHAPNLPTLRRAH